jgi:lysophospholipase L1-like esterase
MKQFLQRKLVRVGAVSLAAMAAATTFGIPSASAHDSKRVIVGMGDSFTAGEGAPPFDPRTNTEENSCHRSLFSYPNVAATLTRRANVRNVACSGAETTDLFTTFKTEPAQVSKLKGATDIVLTIGGNDIDALGAVTDPPTPEEYAAQLQELAPKLINTYTRIQAAAPNAELHVMGYPLLFAAGPQPGCFLDEAQRAFLITAQNALNQTIQAAAGAAGANYVDDSAAFAGHELCTTRPWVNAPNAEHPEYSLHPNHAGYVALGVRVKQAL